jgi:4-hydroxy-2-oxoheptanedioate aldolase
VAQKAGNVSASEIARAPERLNGIIRQLEIGGTAFAALGWPNVEHASEIADSPYDGVIVEMEHFPFEVRVLRDYLQYLLSRRDIASRGSIAPAVTPLVRVPANGSEMTQWMAKQALDVGCYGIVWPHVDTVEQARNAVAACRFYRSGSSAGAPSGERGFGAVACARYFGLSPEEYFERADVWPLNPSGEILVTIMIESPTGVANLAPILEQVKGVGAVIVGTGDLAVNAGYPMRADNREVRALAKHALAVCNDYGVACGVLTVEKNVTTVVEEGYRLVVVVPEHSLAALQRGREVAGRPFA